MSSEARPLDRAHQNLGSSCRGRLGLCTCGGHGESEVGQLLGKVWGV